MKDYRTLGYPKKNGLTTNGVLLRRHHDPDVVAVMETWFSHVMNYSARDQLSFQVAAWLHQFAPGVLDLDLMNNHYVEWPFPKNQTRLPRDFDDERYLDLHADVKAAGMDPRKHYLLFGLKEQRRYK